MAELSLIAENVTEVILPDSSVLETKILHEDISVNDIDSFVKMHVPYWKMLDPLTGDILLENIAKGIIIGGYLNGEPAALLRTAALYVPQFGEIKSDPDTTPREKVKEVLSHIPQTFDELTDSGRWNEIPDEANVTGLIDITRPDKFRNYEVARGLILYYAVRFVYEKRGFKRPNKVRNVELDFTFTPKPNDYNGDPVNYDKKIIGWHMKNGALNSGHVFVDGRPGQDAIAMFYRAPGFQAEIPKGLVIQENRIILPQANCD